MRNFLYILILVAATSCSKKMLPSETIVKDSTATSIVYIPKDSIIKIAGDSVTIHDTIPCPDAVYHKQVTSNKGTLKATVDINKGKLNIDCKQDSLQQRISWFEKEVERLKNHFEYKQIPVPTPVPTPYIPKWVWYLTAINLLSLVWKYRSFLLTTIKKI
ncbi:MAG: hypothetical protein NTZ59_11755 [Bacteroidetes bacterium]|nr:hypothetical protein [Bacteroidota bacterium]